MPLYVCETTGIGYSKSRMNYWLPLHHDLQTLCVLQAITYNRTCTRMASIQTVVMRECNCLQGSSCLSSDENHALGRLAM